MCKNLTLFGAGCERFNVKFVAVIFVIQYLSDFNGELNKIACKSSGLKAERFCGNYLFSNLRDYASVISAIVGCINIIIRCTAIVYFEVPNKDLFWHNLLKDLALW